ncbi:uncharacterized protein V6R79_007488 [Siganus canaliculatus]
MRRTRGSARPSDSLCVNIVHGLDQFRSRMIVMDVDMRLVVSALAGAAEIAARLHSVAPGALNGRRVNKKVEGS